MISNMQHQQLDDAVMAKMALSKQSVVVEKYVNNNNNNMNKNIHMMTSAEILSSANQNPDVLIYDPSVDYFDINSSLDTKEIITVAASQPLYENAPLIPARPATTTTSITSSTKTLRENVDEGDIEDDELKSETQLLVDAMNVQRENPRHEYALKKSGRDWKPLNKHDRVLTVNNMDNQVESYRSQQRQQSRSDVLRCIEDVHNYSKINRFDDSPNCSSPEEDDDDDEEDIDDEYDDDVFGSTSKHAKTNKHHAANSSYETCTNNSNQPGRQSKLQSQSFTDNHHKDTLNLSFDEEMLPHTKNSSILKRCTTISSSTSTKSSVNSPTTPTCDDVPDEMVGIGENDIGLNGEKTAPDHHARRPMNAFLIFCKRHRAIVRDKYKNLENRQITKILGEWWATLSNIEKGCYTELAKQYKDAFFKANPNFKWYKLPAPPLRTCTIRPGHHSPTSPGASNNFYLAEENYTSRMMNGSANDDGVDRFNCDTGYVRKSSSSTNNHTENIYSDTSNNRNGSNSSNSISHHHMNKSAVGMFKFADEAQMGGLSSLMSGSNSSSSSSSPNGNRSEQKDDAIRQSTKDNNAENRNDQNRRHDALQSALSETSEFLSANMPENKNDMEPFQNMRNHALHMESSQVLNGKRKGSDDPVAWSIKKKPHSPVDGLEYDFSPRKAARSCKGKRYQELITSGQIISSGKKAAQKIKPTAANGTTNGYYRGFDRLQDSSEHNSTYYDQISLRASKVDKVEITIPDQMEYASPYASQPQPESPNNQKQFDASDFDLEEKIKALPAQCLESYLVRKRETKKKKKIGSKRRTTSSTSYSMKAQQFQKQQSQRQVGQRLMPPETIHEARERMQSAMVGSQKRKARKESITRRDVNAICSSNVDLLSPTKNNVFDAVGLVKLNDAIKVEYDADNYTYGQVVDGLMTIIKEEPADMPDSNHHSNSAPTSDLLILAEVATNHIGEEVNN